MDAAARRILRAEQMQKGRRNACPCSWPDSAPSRSAHRQCRLRSIPYAVDLFDAPARRTIPIKKPWKVIADI